MEGLALLALAVTLLLAVGCLWLGLDLRRQSRLQQEREQAYEQRLQALEKHLALYRRTSISMGDSLHELRQLVQPLPERLALLEQRDPQVLSVTQANRLVEMGASVDELTQSCGLSKAEAQLLSRMHQGGKR